jgi:hypothetical protein
MKNIVCLFIPILCISLSSCKRDKGEKKYSKQSDYSFRISESDVTITCSKRAGAEFYVMFSKDSTQLSDSVDYLKYKTGDMSEVNLVFDPQNRNKIYIKETEYLKDINPINYNFAVLQNKEFDSLFFEPRVRTEPLVLKYPFIKVGISPSGYAIYVKRYRIVYEKIKEGDIYGW